MQECSAFVKNMTLLDEYADVCCHTLTYADVCGRMQECSAFVKNMTLLDEYADVC